LSQSFIILQAEYLQSLDTHNPLHYEHCTFFSARQTISTETSYGVRNTPAHEHVPRLPLSSSCRPIINCQHAWQWPVTQLPRYDHMGRTKRKFKRPWFKRTSPGNPLRP